MKSLLVYVLTIGILILGTIAKTEAGNNQVPEKVAKEWIDNLHNSPYVVYEKFDDVILNYDFVKGQINDTIHVKFYMGCSNPDETKIEYRTFMIYIHGKEGQEDYTNDYSNIFYNKGSEWIKCDKAMLQAWSSNWVNYLKKNNLDTLKAFVVPNEDITTLKNKIYLIYGMEKTSTGNEIKLMLSNHPIKAASSNKNLNDEIVYMDACMPCPKVCGHGNI